MREKFLGGGVTYMCCVSYLQVVCWLKIGSAAALLWMLSLLVLVCYVDVAPVDALVGRVRCGRVLCREEEPVYLEAAVYALRVGG